MGQSPSKPAATAAVEQLAPTTPDVSRSPPRVLLSYDSPVSPLGHSSRRDFVSLSSVGSGPHETEGATRTRRDSDAVGFSDEGSTIIESQSLRPLYGPCWYRKSQLPTSGSSQHQRSDVESYVCKDPETKAPVFEIHPIREKPSLRIICPQLSGVLKQASMGSLSDFRVDGSFSPTSAMVEPYEFLFHNRKKISQTAKEDAGTHTTRHLELLLDFVRKERPSAWEKRNELDNGDCRRIAFEDIWLLYPPGTTVFARDHGGWRAYKVERIESSPDAMLIHCLYLDFDTTGEYLTPKREVLTARSYSSELPIGDLEVVPDWYFRRLDGFTECLLERGKKFWGLGCKVNHKEYYGQAWPRSSQQGPTNIVIDYVTSSKYMPSLDDRSGRVRGSSACLPCLGEALGLPSYPAEAPHDVMVCTKSLPNLKHQSENCSKRAQDSLLFCPPRIWAFSLRYKTWEQILPRDIGDVQRQDDALAQLVMKPEVVKYLESALHTYRMEYPRNAGEDVTKRNPGGFTILLHGNAGTGKTFTAECLAAKHGIPLYKVTCADLGTDLDVLEKRLHEISLRAANWKAILLLDEADMFIRKREVHDLRQYAIVSIFLHHLDSSEALLFMTSTRIDRLDQALEARVPMPIHLPDHSFDAQKRIWENLIWRLENPSDTRKEVLKQWLEFDLKEAEDGAYTSMNGRQIKACITASMALARKENKNLEIAHVREMLRLGREFRDLVQDSSDDPRDRNEFLKRQMQRRAQRSAV